MGGVSTRRVDELVQAMGLSGIGKSTVSKLCKDIDDRVNAFLDRPLEGDWPYLWLDATYLKQREGGRIVCVAAIIAVAANTEVTMVRCSNNHLREGNGVFHSRSQEYLGAVRFPSGRSVARGAPAKGTCGSRCPACLHLGPGRRHRSAAEANGPVATVRGLALLSY